MGAVSPAGLGVEALLEERELEPETIPAYGSARDIARLFAYAQASAPSLFSETATSTISLISADGRIAHETSIQNADRQVIGRHMAGH